MLYRIGFRVNKETESPWILMLNTPKSDEPQSIMPDQDIILLNIETMEIEILPDFPDSRIKDCNWMGVNIVLVNAWDTSTNSEVTYYVDMNNF